MVRPSRQKLTIRCDLTKLSICWMSFCSYEPMHEDVCLMDEELKILQVAALNADCGTVSISFMNIILNFGTKVVSGRINQFGRENIYSKVSFSFTFFAFNHKN